MKDFTPISNRLLAEAESTAIIATYAAIARHRDSQIGLAVTGIALIARTARVSKPTCILALRWLREHGFIDVVSRHGHSQGFAYRLPDLEETGKNEEPVKGKTGASDLPLLTETGKDQTPEPVKNRPPYIDKKKRKIKEQSLFPTEKSTSTFELPDWMPVDLWKEFAEFREQKKKPLTPGIVKRILGDLEKWKRAGHDPKAILETTIRRGWLDVFEPKTQSHLATPTAPAQQAKYTDPRAAYSGAEYQRRERMA